MTQDSQFDPTNSESINSASANTASSNASTSGNDFVANNTTQQKPPFQIHKIYVKDCTFEMPAGTSIFTKEWKPELSVQIGTVSKPLAEENTHEVTLEVKCEVKSAGELAFKLELKQSGIFGVHGLELAQLHHTLGAFCPSILYPYARECICDLVLKAGFPQLNLAPINFDVLYQQELANKNKQPEAEAQTVH